MGYEGVFENILRVGTVTAVDYESQICTFKMYDRVEQQEWRAALPHPAPGDGFGVFTHIEPGCLVLVGWGNREQPFIVSCVPNNSFSRDITSSVFTDNIRSDSSAYPSLREAEVAISGKDGNLIHLTNDGCIDVRFGGSCLFLDHTDKVTLATEVTTTRTESSLTRSGIILRDLRNRSTTEEETEDKQIALDHFRYLSGVSRDPFFSPVLQTSGLTKGFIEQIRNPPYTEERKIIREFGHEYMVGTIDEEKERTKEENDFSFLFQPNSRTETDYDVLNLNVENPGLLIESVQGTLVDIYGNLLDLNRNIIRFPSDEEGRKNIDKRLPQLSVLNRRSVKLHYEINSKKNVDGEVAVDVLDGPDIPNGHVHSRWSIDVDAEGLTKLNIPASSNIGNIPLLSRYVTTHLKKKTKDIDVDPNEDRPTQDILHLGFGDVGGDGVAIPEVYSPSDLAGAGLIKYRTAYHDIIYTAGKALEGQAVPGAPGQPPFDPDGAPSEGDIGDASDAADDAPPPTAPGPSSPGESVPALQAFIDNTIPDADTTESPNAGGRSLHANLDGSLELNIGRDSVDHKSVVLDTSGGIVSRIGRLKDESNAASVISQLDGHVYIQVGGDAVEGEEPIETPKVRLVVKGKDSQDEITIDENRILIKGGNGKNIALLSQGDIVLGAKGKILLAGATVGIHGGFDSATGDITSGPHRLVTQKGKEI